MNSIVMPKQQATGIGHQFCSFLNFYFFSDYYNLNFIFKKFNNYKSKHDWNDFFKFHELFNTEFNNDSKKIINIECKGKNKLKKKEEILKHIKNYKNSNNIVFKLNIGVSITAYHGVFDYMEYKIKDIYFKHNRDEFLHHAFFNKKWNIVLHIRRGDIFTFDNGKQFNRRFSPISYYIENLKLIFQYIFNNDTNIIVFTQNKFSKNEEKELLEFENVYIEKNKDDRVAFHTMCKCDFLLVSKRSHFSYIPALINSNLKFSEKIVNEIDKDQQLPIHEKSVLHEENIENKKEKIKNYVYQSTR